MELVVAEFGHVTQLVPKPEVSELVCASNRQPVWSDGQDKLRFPLLNKLVSVTGAVETTVAGSTEILPSTARVLVQDTPAPTMVSAPPLASGLLKSLNLLPATSVLAPRLLTINSPEPALVIVPATTIKSLDCASDLFNSMARLPFSVRLPLMVSVPTVMPGASVPAEPTVTEPAKEPVPPSVPLLTTVRPL